MEKEYKLARNVVVRQLFQATKAAAQHITWEMLWCSCASQVERVRVGARGKVLRQRARRRLGRAPGAWSASMRRGSRTGGTGEEEGEEKGEEREEGWEAHWEG